MLNNIRLRGLNLLKSRASYGLIFHLGLGFSLPRARPQATPRVPLGTQPAKGCPEAMLQTGRSFFCSKVTSGARLFSCQGFFLTPEPSSPAAYGPACKAKPEPRIVYHYSYNTIYTIVAYTNLVHYSNHYIWYRTTILTTISSPTLPLRSSSEIYH